MPLVAYSVYLIYNTESWSYIVRLYLNIFFVDDLCAKTICSPTNLQNLFGLWSFEYLFSYEETQAMQQRWDLLTVINCEIFSKCIPEQTRVSTTKYYLIYILTPVTFMSLPGYELEIFVCMECVWCSTDRGKESEGTVL